MNIDAMLHDMSVEEKVGQLFLLAFAGNRLDEARVLMEEQLVGAAYISNDNIPTPAAAFELSSELQSFANQTRLKIPLLLGVDQEGTWSVMSDGSTMGPGNMALGATHNPEVVYQMYEVLGKELMAVGLNVLLAPCVDCNSNPSNSIIGMRSFGEFPEHVAAMSVAAIKGAIAGGVIPTVKHFPGHGDTTLDSHRGLPSVARNRTELERIDLAPFKAGIEAGVQIVMTSHILFPALDTKNPATLSHTILQTVLREELGFEGVIISDSMNMHSMKKNYHPHHAAIQAINAGVDLLMLAEEHYDHDAERYLQQQQALIGAVINAVRTGSIAMSRVDQAVRRVLRLKAQVENKPTVSQAQALAVVGSAAHRQVELNAALKAITILKDEAQRLPLAADTAVVIVNTTARSSYSALGNTRGIGPNQRKPAFDTFAEAMQGKRDKLTILSAEEVLGNSAAIPENALVVAVTENYVLPGMDFDQTTQQTIIELLLKHVGNRLIVAALRDPYELRDFPYIPAYICAFSFRPCAALAMSTVLCGETSAVQGKSPVSIA
jgi:beta-N-acetylhexosaminidase